ncbi:protein kinase [candidate division KSB3 bacterium]|uniref:non-specific serine/threonine protein kinase n=1 Tax=candidate division KSB3 bacterium TaxID=2044937 RepID=A0A9D5Q3W9_9BACT|nr:protein kinase [candidate division KSB3 bacterium]MBD3323099.1 protein kinase [candidate division KSB3 bacterium]
MEEQPAYTVEDAKAFERARDYLKAADIYFAYGDYQKAESLYRTLEKRFPFHKDIKFKLGRLLTLKKQWDEAILKLQEVGTSSVFIEDTLYLLAECFRNKGMIHAAKEIYVDLLERNYHYKDARQKLQALESPGFSDLAATQQTALLSSGTTSHPNADAQHQTMQGFAVEDRYTLLEELGRGGMGIVYKAEDVRAKRLVAIKVLPPYLATDESHRVRFFREAKVIASLHHPHIVPVLEVNRQENFLVMEYIPGGTLQTWAQQHHAEPEELLPFILQVLDALHTVHQRGIIHRDLKPQNILIADAATAKLTDFGIAHICGATITRTGTHLGTLPYMAPEQILGSSVDVRTDIYAMGVVLYEVLTGQLPFTGKDTSYHHIHTAPRPPREITSSLASELNAVVLRCLAKKPDDRYQDAKALQQALSAEREP